MKVVIIGGVAAGAKTAAKIRSLSRQTEIVIYTQDTHVSYSACGLPYYIEGNFEDYRNLLVRLPEDFEKVGVFVFLQNRVTKIIPDKKEINVLDLKNNKQFTDNYDVLVIATGAIPFIPDIKNFNLKNVFTLRTIEDGINIRNTMRKSSNAVIIGAGYIGMEILEAFVKNGLKVSLISHSPYIMPMLSEDISSLIQNYVSDKCKESIDLYTNETVVEFFGEDKVTAVKTANGKVIETDFVLLCAGIRPVVDIAKDAGIELGITGAIRVNSRMQTNIKDIYACGDCAEKINIISQTPMWIPLGSTANKEGRCAAMNICGYADDFEGVLGSAVTRFFDLTISKTGLSERIAKNLGFDIISEKITEIDKAGYMPNVDKVTIKMIADKRSHKILGAEAIGSIDADKRINSLTSGLINGLTVHKLSSVDITYAPPFSVNIDPVIILAQKLEKKLQISI